MAGREVEVPFPIGDAVSFTGSIVALRQILANHRGDRRDILDTHPDQNVAATKEHPLLAENNAGDQPARWLHINFHVVGEEGASSATLFVQDNNLYCMGFRNQNGVCYQLTNPEGWTLPQDYNAVPLDWGDITYKSILNVREKDYMKKLNSARLGKTVAADAVRELSRFTPPMANGDANARLALAGLIIMVCESAKMNPLCDAFARGWSTGMRFTKKLMDCIGNWELISVALLNWKDDNYDRWTIHPRLAEITGVKSPIDALQVIHLVRNFTVEERQLLHYAI